MKRFNIPGTPSPTILTKAEQDLLERHRRALRASYDLSPGQDTRSAIDPQIDKQLEQRIFRISKGLDLAGSDLRRDLRLSSLRGRARTDFDIER